MSPSLKSVCVTAAHNAIANAAVFTATIPQSGVWSEAIVPETVHLAKIDFEAKLSAQKPCSFYTFGMLLGVRLWYGFFGSVLESEAAFAAKVEELCRELGERGKE